jgi:hypothetical protein
MSAYTGNCHCGRIGVIFFTALKASDFTPRACSCSFCCQHRAAYLTDSAGRIELHTAGDEVYRFGFGITDFHVCPRCGVLVGAIWNDGAGGSYGVVNMQTLDDVSAFMESPKPMNFVGEDLGDREHRRRTHWTPATLFHR